MSRRFFRALYVGRFQPFHLGHLEAVKYILNNAEEIIILVGSAQESHTLENPFTAGERVYMIRLALNEIGVNPSKYYIIPVIDVNVHSLWVSHVCSYTPKFDVVYSNEPLTRRLFIESGFRVESIPFFRREIYSATEIRRRILSDANWEELLPRSVAAYIREIGGIERLKDLAKTDKVIQ
ncbi:MAG: nicotinamide-nucleotide adenylyltransferase [Candidatus Bathyarchaeia archaeon]|nr:nicotinamide-nucleotide adenylyltransferase [Candidatus Bathyarchaeota archaeon]